MKRAPETKASRLSITLRLTILYAFSAFVILSVSCLYLYVELGEQLERQNQHFLRDEINVLRALLWEDPEGLSRLRQEIALENSNMELVRHYVRLLDEGGNVLASSPAMMQRIPVEVFPEVGQDSGRFGRRIRWRGPMGTPYILKAVRVTGGEFPPRLLHIALDITYMDKIQRHHRRNLFIVLLFGVSISALTGMIVARRGLAPLQSITRATQSISANRLDDRIGDTPWPAELVSLASAFDRMLERLEESFNRLSQCAGDLAHELRTPIGNLMGEAEVALVKNREPEEYRHILASSLEEFDRLSRMIDKILFLARADSRKEVLNVSSFDVAEAIREVVEFHGSLAEEQAVTIHRRGEAVIRGDRSLFQRVIANLLTNALKHTPAGGEVRLTVNALEGESVSIEVADDGCGIEPVHLPKIFDRFYCVDHVRTGGGRGSGLGLPMVKSIMELHEGTISITSQPGIGTTATVVFPPSTPAGSF